MNPLLKCDCVILGSIAARERLGTMRQNIGALVLAFNGESMLYLLLHQRAAPVANRQLRRRGPNELDFEDSPI